MDLRKDEVELIDRSNMPYSHCWASNDSNLASDLWRSLSRDKPTEYGPVSSDALL